MIGQLQRYIILALAALVVAAGIGFLLEKGKASVAGLRADAAVSRADQAAKDLLAAQGSLSYAQGIILSGRASLLDASGREQQALEDKQHAKDEADRTISDLRSGQLRLKSRLAAAAKADPTGSVGTAQSQESPGLRPEDAEFLVRFAEDADKAVIERNEAVDGWQKCRVISDQDSSSGSFQPSQEGSSK